MMKCMFLGSMVLGKEWTNPVHTVCSCTGNFGCFSFGVKKEVMQVSASTATELSYLIVKSHESYYHPVPFSCLQRDLTRLEPGCLMVSFEVISFAGQAL